MFFQLGSWLIKVAVRIKLIWLPIFLTMRNNMVLIKVCPSICREDRAHVTKDSIQLYVISLGSRIKLLFIIFYPDKFYEAYT